MKKQIVIFVLCCLGVTSSAIASEARASSPENAKVYFVNLSQGETVPSTFNIVFGLRGMGVAPAGFDKPNTGHHHLLIDMDTLPDMSQPLPSNAHIKHFRITVTVY